MAKKAPLSYKQRASRLRKLKLLPENYKLNDLGESEKRHIRRLENQFSETVAKAPYIKPIKIPKSAGKVLKGKGFTVKGNYLLVDKQRANNVRFRKSDNSLIFDFDGRRYISYPYDDSAETYARMNSFFDNIKPGQSMSLKIGDSGFFHRVNVRNAKDLDKYLESFQPKTITAWDFLNVVEIRPGKSNGTKAKKNSGIRSGNRPVSKRKKT